MPIVNQKTSKERNSMKMSEKIWNCIGTKILEKIEDNLKERIEKQINEEKERKKWYRCIEEACYNTEEIEENTYQYLIEKTSIQRWWEKLYKKQKIENIYYKFILTIGMELMMYKRRKDYVLALALAILDNWFEKNEMNVEEFKQNINLQEIKEIIENEEKLTRAYFKMFDDKYGSDTIRIYYPRNGEDWIRKEKKHSICIRVNLSKGCESGFCRIGFEYYKIKKDNQKEEQPLLIAVKVDGKEILRFEKLKQNERLENIIWAR